jgi:hypothetical protein
MLSPKGQSPDHPARQLQLESSHAPPPASSAPVRPPSPRRKTDSHRPRPLRSGRKNFPPKRPPFAPSRSTILITSTSPTALRQLSSTIRFAASTASHSLAHSSSSPLPSPLPSRPGLLQFPISIIMEIMGILQKCNYFPCGDGARACKRCGGCGAGKVRRPGVRGASRHSPQTTSAPIRPPGPCGAGNTLHLCRI